jgi:hypothetical protein
MYLAESPNLPDSYKRFSHCMANAIDKSISLFHVVESDLLSIAETGGTDFDESLTLQLIAHRFLIPEMASFPIQRASSQWISPGASSQRVPSINFVAPRIRYLRGKHA